MNLMEDGALHLDFPEGEPQKISLERHNAILGDLSRALKIDQDEISDIWLCSKTRKLVVEIRNSTLLPFLDVQVPFLYQLPFDQHKLDVKGVIVTAHPTEKDTQHKQYDFISRYFSPWNGISEDPVCGSAQYVTKIKKRFVQKIFLQYVFTPMFSTVMAPYWSHKLHKDEFSAFQVSKRGGHLLVARKNKRVVLGGHAVTFLKGSFEI